MRWALTHAVEMLMKINLDPSSSKVLKMQLRNCVGLIYIIADLIEDSRQL